MTFVVQWYNVFSNKGDVVGSNPGAFNMWGK